MNITNKGRLPWVLFAALMACLLILTMGPFLSVHSMHPLQSLHERLLAIIGLLLLFCLSSIVSIKQSHSPEANIDRHLLSQCRKQYLKLLRACFHIKHGAWPTFQKKPCTLVLGNPSSGKSQLIQSLSLQAQTVTQMTPIPSSCHMPTWWHSNDQTWLELCTEPTKAHTPEVLKKLLRYMKWRNWLMPVSHVIIAIDLKQLYQHNSRQQIHMISKINELLIHIQKHYQDIPTHMVFTKSDLINGFTDYYTRPTAATPTDVLGIELTKQGQTSDTIEASLNHLITQLHQQMFEKIHTERSLPKKQSIQDFIRQIDALKPTMISITKNTFQHTGIHCHGIYFSSNEQNENTIDYLAKPMEQAFNLHNNDRPTPFPGNQVFLSAGMMQSLKHSQHSYMVQRVYIKTAMLVACVLLSALCLTYMYQNAWWSMQSKMDPLFATNAGSLPIQPSANQLASISQSITQHIENKLQTDIDQQSIQTYADLTTYLALGRRLKQIHNNTQTLEYLFQSQHAQALNARQKKQLHTWLDHWNQHKQSIGTEDHLIKAALKVIQHQSITDMIDAQLSLPLTMTPITGAHASHHPYMPDDFSPMIHTAIPTAIQTFKQFQQQYPLIAISKQDNLTQSLRDAYIGAYQTHWERYILEPIGREPQNIADAIDMLGTIENDQTGLISHLQRAVHATISNPDPLFQQRIASRFRPYQSYLSNQSGSITIYLDQLKKQLLMIEKSPLPLQTAFKVSRSIALKGNQPNAISMILQHADDAPQPIAHWLSQATHTVWQLVLSDSKKYINHQWHNTIYRPYMQKIDGKFPFDSHTAVDVDPDDFKTFFAANGLMNAFFDQYLEPFAHQHGRYWQWKNMYGQGLGISQAHLDTFTRSQLITEMFFQGHDQIASIGFSLQPIQVPNDVRRISVHIGDAQSTFQSGHIPMTYFHWPTVPYISNISVENQYHSLNGITRSGYWGLFHLLAEAKSHPNPNNNHITLSYNMNGETILMDLQPFTNIHPFMPNILNQLRAYRDL